MDVINLADKRESERLKGLKKDVAVILKEAGIGPESMFAAMHRKAIEEDQRKKDNNSLIRRMRLNKGSKK